MENSELSDELFKNGKVIKLQKGEVLHNDHDKCTSLGKVISGKLRLSRPLTSGREIILKEFGPEELFAELIVFSGENYPGWLIASESSTVTEVDYQHILEYLDDRDSMVTFICGISKKLNHLTNKIEIMSLKTVKQKIAFSLLTDSLQGALSVSKTADTLGCSREALSRALSELEQEGAIVRKDGELRITERRMLEVLF